MGKADSMASGHILAALVMTGWGLTFIGTKILLRSFSPTEIILMRFILSYLTLWLVHPAILRTGGIKEELPYIIAGTMGVTCYYLLENVALTLTMASNVGIIIATSPFFTAILAGIVYGKEERADWHFYLGCMIAFAGIIIISVNGAELHMNPLGDLLTVGAAISWAFYGLAMKKIHLFCHDNILNSRRIFFWGLLTSAPICLISGFHPDYHAIIQPLNLTILLALGTGAGAICYVLWNMASEILGPVRVNVYIYLDPVVAVLGSALILHEPVTAKAVAGIVLILGGLIYSETHGSF